MERDDILEVASSYAGMELLETFVRAGDIVNAYWLIRSDETRNVSVPISSTLLASVQAARWIRHLHDRIVDDLRGIIRNYVLPGDIYNRFNIAIYDRLPLHPQPRRPLAMPRLWLDLLAQIRQAAPPQLSGQRVAGSQGRASPPTRRSHRGR